MSYITIVKKKLLMRAQQQKTRYIQWLLLCTRIEHPGKT